MSNQEAAQKILNEIATLYAMYRIPEVSVKHGEIEIEYQWTSPRIEKIYKQKLQQLADVSIGK